MSKAETQKVQMVKGQREVAVELVTVAIYLGVMYYAMNPDELEELKDRVTKWWRIVAHRISVHTAIRAIRDLPETPDN